MRNERPISKSSVKDNRSGVATILSIKVTRNNAELLCRVNVRRSDTARDSRDVGIIVINAVNQEVVITLALSINREPATDFCRSIRT